jgi:hypothetical protein
MNYEQALKALHHARGGRLLDRKKVGNETWLECPPPAATGVTGAISLVLFKKYILAWLPNGDIELNNRGFWSYTTKDRYNKYLPQGFSVWQEHPYWYLKTPTGVRAFTNGMVVGADGSYSGMTGQVNAKELLRQVQEYAKLYAGRLVRGEILEASRHCPGCARPPPEPSPYTAIPPAHALAHVQSSTTPASLALNAVLMARRSDRSWPSGPASLSNILLSCWQEHQFIWRPAHSKKALVRQTEARFLQDKVPLNIVPSKYKQNLRWLIEDYLLDMFGFERMT